MYGASRLAFQFHIKLKVAVDNDWHLTSHKDFYKIFVHQCFGLLI